MILLFKSEKHNRNNSYMRIISIYLLVCIVGLVISIPIFNNLISKHDLQISNNMCGLIAEKLNDSITYLTEAVDGRADFISSSKMTNWDDLYSDLVNNVKNGDYISIGLIDITGKFYGNENENIDFQKWGLIEQARKVKKEFFSPPYRQALSGKMVVTIFAPIYQKGEFVGNLFMTYDLEKIQNMAKSEILADKLEIYLMNPFSNNYIICYGENSELVGSWNNTRLLYDRISTGKGKSYSEWEAEMREGKNGSLVVFEQDGVQYTQVFVNIDVMEDWSVVVRIPKNALSYDVRKFNMEVTATIVILIISLLLLFILSNRSANAERKMLEYLSTHDPLTKLINRRAFEDIYKYDFYESDTLNQRGALIFLDIDFFKQINDGFGHDMGDRAIREFAMIAEDIFCRGGIVSRFGGDEFVILIKKLDSRKKVEHQLKDFRKRLRELDFLVEPDGKVFRIHYSAGIVEVNGFTESLEEIEKKADKALYQVKRKGKDGFAWYDGCEN